MTVTRATVLTRPPERAPYEPIGAARQVWRSRAPEVLSCGPADTGKSRGCLEKVHYCASKYPHIRCLIVRKTQESLNQSALVTYEKKVLPQGVLAGSAVEGRKPIARYFPGIGKGPRIYFSTQEQEYVYPNGSIIAIGGMDKPSKIMSAEFDLIFAMEATELTEEDWEVLSVRKRNSVMPYQQLLADCNPSYPTHWLKRRCDRGVTRMFYARFEDNPTITPERMAILERLTGVRRQRLFEGIWAAAEGLVYNEWNPAVHQTTLKHLEEWGVFYSAGVQF